MKKEISDVVIECVQGDISSQNDVEAVVNAANSQLASGGGVAGAIHRTAGPELYEACKDFAPIDVGECVLTDACNLPNSYVVHCLGPRYGVDNPAKDLLTSCYKKALDLCEEEGIKSVAFPSISTGAFGYPFKDGVEIALNAIYEKIFGLESLEQIRFVLYSEGDLKVFQEVFENLGR